MSAEEIAEACEDGASSIQSYASNNYGETTERDKARMQVLQRLADKAVDIAKLFPE